MKSTIFFLTLFFGTFLAHAQDIKEIVRLADEKFRGTSSQGEMTMIIQRPTWS